MCLLPSRIVAPLVHLPCSAEVRSTIEQAADLAPLHNPPNLMGIDAALQTFAGVPQASWQADSGAAPALSIDKLI